MKKNAIVTYILSLVCISVTSIALDRAMVTADVGWILLASLAAILSLLTIMLTFSTWKSK